MPRMRRLAFAIVLLTVTWAPAVGAQEAGHGPGVGVEANLGGLRGAAFVYDASAFHIDVLFALAHASMDGPDTSIFGVGARFFYVLHRLGPADFGLGAGLGIIDSDVGGRSDTEIQIEGGAQIRAFIVPNVSLTASLGLVILSADRNTVQAPFFTAEGDSAFGIGGQAFAEFGLVYFFR
jgi:hypothetical protein